MNVDKDDVEWLISLLVTIAIAIFQKPPDGRTKQKEPRKPKRRKRK